MAVAPSVDPVTTTLQAAPLFILFEGSIIACALLDRREAQKRLKPGPRDVRQAVSAGWVIPVDGPPIADAFVAWEDGRIVEVGPGRAERHYGDALILPGLVNAHSHLEYAVYAGFGDGLAFGGWLTDHIARKRRLERDDMVAIARLGAAESLASGITTTADYSFSGAAATAANDLGLRAIVYLEVFGGDAAEAGRRFDGLRAEVDETELVRLGISPHAPYTCSVDVYRYCLSLGIPVGTHLAESDGENEWLEHGTGPLAAARDVLVPPSGRRAVGTLADVLGAGAPLRPLRHGRGARDRRARSRGRSRRALPTIERTARLRRRAVDRSPGRRDPRGARHRLPGFHAVVRRIRRASGGPGCRPSARAAVRRTRRGRGAQARYPGCSARLGPRSGHRQPFPRQASRPDGRLGRRKRVRSR